MAPEQNQHSSLTAIQAQRGLRAAAEEMRKVGLPKAAGLIEECTQSLEEQLEATRSALQALVDYADGKVGDDFGTTEWARARAVLNPAKRQEGDGA